MNQGEIAKRVMSVLVERCAHACGLDDFEEHVFHDRVAVSRALFYLAKVGKVFEFRVDGDPYYVLPKYRFEAYVEQPLKVDEAMAMLYAATGSRLPSTIRRTPSFRPLPDDGEEVVSRYRDGVESF